MTNTEKRNRLVKACDKLGLDYTESRSVGLSNSVYVNVADREVRFSDHSNFNSPDGTFYNFNDYTWFELKKELYDLVGAEYDAYIKNYEAKAIAKKQAESKAELSRQEQLKAIEDKYQAEAQAISNSIRTNYTNEQIAAVKLNAKNPMNLSSDFNTPAYISVYYSKKAGLEVKVDVYRTNEFKSLK